ncbi:serine protease snake-like [Ostrinia nubilalis]|uniref:serine protease snake-like n=1 Tax=Ostrinia nubilalis TaxID=29057 RepID=UPI0030826B54
MYKYITLLSCLCVVAAQHEKSEGAECSDSIGNSGRCVRIRHCKEIEFIKKERYSNICGSSAKDPIICCNTKDLRNTDTCEPASPRRPDMKIGKIAYHKCVDYQEQIKFPCVGYTYYAQFNGSTQTRYTRRDGCSDPPSLVIGSSGVDASRGQFPHMALLGYVKDGSEVEWLCGGTIISEQFILTAGHCTSHKQLGPVSLARLGILKRSDPDKVARDYKIKRFLLHPEYKPPAKYNDIALLETEKRIVFLNKHIVPACLDAGDADVESDAEMASATGWGALGDGEPNADVLQRMDIVKFSTEECSALYKPYRLLKTGLDNFTQVCYGHRQIPRDTCKGDSGGPLQVEYRGVNCMHKVIGVTSFGRACGNTGQPGVYTRVRPYVPWIESVVWPAQGTDKCVCF